MQNTAALHFRQAVPIESSFIKQNLHLAFLLQNQELAFFSIRIQRHKFDDCSYQPFLLVRHESFINN